jgi:predicted dinucleotide-binding enzyme
LSLGVQEASVVEKALPARTSTSVSTLRKEDPAAAPAANLVSVPPVDAALMGVDLIVLSSDSEDEVDWEALIAGDEVDWEALAAKDVDDVESMGSWSPSRI